MSKVVRVDLPLQIYLRIGRKPVLLKLLSRVPVDPDIYLLDGLSPVPPLSLRVEFVDRFADSL